MAPNLVQWDKVLLYCSGGGLWGPCWDILGHFRVILGLRARGWGLFGAYFSPVWLPKRTWNGPISGTVRQVLLGHLGAILGNFGVILGPRPGFGLFGVYFSLIWLTKRA